MVTFTCPALDGKLSYFDKFGPKNQNCLFKIKVNTYSNSNMQNSMAMPICLALGGKYSFWANLVKKLKIVCLDES